MDLAPYIIAGIGIIPTVIIVWAQLRRDKVSASSQLVEDAIKIKNEMKKDYDDMDKRYDDLVEVVEQNTKDIGKMKATIKKLQERVKYLRGGIDILISQIKNAGLLPAWQPCDEMSEEDNEQSIDT